MKRVVAIVALAAVLCLPACSRAPEPGALAGWNVLLVTFDTTRRDRMGFAGYDRADTPVVDDLAARGVVFDDAQAVAPVTLPTHASILTGLYPPRHGALNNGSYPLPDDVPTLAGWLNEAGYDTHAVIGAFVLHSKYGLAREFDSYDDQFAKPRGGSDMHLERKAERVTNRAIDWLEARSGDEPFFLWAHYYDPHVPFDPPAEFRSRFPLDPYDGEIAYTDSQVGRLLAAIDARGQLERTLIVVTADHGEALGDGGEETHGMLLRHSTLRIPFVMTAPGVLPAGRVVGGVASQTDIVPTVLALLGLEADQTFDGESLLPAIGAGSTTDRVVYSHTRLPTDMYGWASLSSARTDRWSWVRAPRPELYDRVNDPQETDSVDDLEPETAAELDDFITAVEAQARETAYRDLGDEERDALESLGYAMSAQEATSSGADPKDMLGLWKETYDLRDRLDRKEFDFVARRAEELLEQDPLNPKLMMIAGQAHIGRQNPDVGIEFIRRAYEITGSHEQAGTVLARAMVEAGRADEGQALLETFTRIEPDYSEHWYNLGVLHSSRGDQAAAIEAYEEAFRLNPGAVHAAVNLASMLSETGDRSERPLELLDQAIELAFEDDRPSLVRARVLGRLGRAEEAQAALRALADRPRLYGIDRKAVAEAMRELSGS